MTKKSKAFVVILACVLLASIAVTGFGWFTSSRTEPIGVTSFVRKSYFQSGTGTAEQPFEIKYPVQLYYFTWLQDMGYFNIQQDDQHRVKPTHFYLSEDLDMSGFNLPPAGSQQFPFLGEFDGRNHKISNLTVCNQEGNGILTDVPKETKAADKSTILEKTDPQIVGFFGVVGEYKGVLSTNKQVVSVKNFDLENETIQSNHPKEGKTLVGIAAGYINATVENVGVAESTLQVGQNIQALDPEKTTNFSDYTLAGYCTEEYKEQVDLTETKVSEPKVETSAGSGSESGNAWGGSIGMRSMYHRLLGIQRGASGLQFPVKKILRTDPDGNHSTEYVYEDLSNNFRAHDAGDGGTFTFNKHSNGWDTESYIYLYGEIPSKYKNQETIQRVETRYNAHRISDGTNYLNVSDGVLAGGTSAADATGWFFSNSATKDGVIHTISGGKTYYLNADSSSGLHLSKSNQGSTVWTSVNGKLRCTINGVNYYLIFENGNWKISIESISVITDRNGHFLTYNGTDFPSVSIAEDATDWKIGSDGKIYTFYQGEKQYLTSLNKKLAVTTDSAAAVVWTHNGTNFSCVDHGITLYLGYDEATSAWTLQSQSKYTVSDGNGNYLDISDGNVINRKKIGKASQIEFSEPGDLPAGKMQCNGHYLKVGKNQKGNWVLSTGEKESNAGRWINDGSGGLYYENNNQYLVVKKQDNKNKWVPSESKKNLVIEPVAFTPPNSKNQTINISLPMLTVRNFNYVDAVETLLSDEPYTYDPYATYIPLSTVDDSVFENAVLDLDNNRLKANPANTGYVIAGSKVQRELRNGLPVKSGDIRVSQYRLDGTLNTDKNLHNSYTGDYGDGSGVTIYSKSYKVPDQYTAIVGKDETTINNLGLQKFKSSEKLMGQILQGESYVYGLHFMDAQIGMDNLLTVDKNVFLNGDTFQNFQFPKDSIDFTLKKKGYINFFAGTYYPGNNSFFSLHEIIRDKDADGKPKKNADGVYAIKDIKEIEKVYGNPRKPKKPYVYKYAGENEPNLTLPQYEGYECMFNTAWIKTQSNLTEQAIYYFEIPVNAGEYALGSVSGSDGAYLMYLDISANAQEVQCTNVTEITSVTSQEARCIKGIQMLDKTELKGTDPLDSTNSVCVSLPVPAAGSAINTTISRSGNDVTMTGADQKNATYIGGGITLHDDSGALTANPISSNKKITKVFTQIEKNLTMDEVTTTVTTTEEIYKNGVLESRTAKKTVNGGPAETVENPAAIDLPAENALAYHFSAANTATVTQTISRNEIVVDQYPAAGEPAVDRSELIKRYDVTITTDQEIVVTVDVANRDTFINNNKVTNAGQKIRILPG